MRVEDVQRVAAAVWLWVWTREYSSKDEEFPAEHAAAVVGQRRNLPLSLMGVEGRERIVFLCWIPDTFGLQVIKSEKKKKKRRASIDVSLDLNYTDVLYFSM